MRKQKQMFTIALLVLQIALTAMRLMSSQTSTPAVNVTGIDNTVIILNIGG